VGCEFERLIERRVLGDLAADDAARLRAHAAGCAACGARLDEASYMETLLVGAFRDVESRLRSPREAVLRAIGEARPGRASRGGRPPRTLWRRLARVVALQAVAAALILAASLGYVYRGLLLAQRQALTVQAKIEAKNLAIVLRAMRERRAAAAPAGPTRPDADLAGALACLGIERDPFGNPFVLDESGRLVSFGANGRDERGGGDDIAVSVR
jgi:anti-sigma factor RsiW